MFNLDGVIWDSPLHAVADNKDTGEVYYRLPDISDVSIDISADTKDSVDKDGALIKRSYTAKTSLYKRIYIIIHIGIINGRFLILPLFYIIQLPIY